MIRNRGSPDDTIQLQLLWMVLAAQRLCRSFPRHCPLEFVNNFNLDLAEVTTHYSAEQLLFPAFWLCFPRHRFIFLWGIWSYFSHFQKRDFLTQRSKLASAALKPTGDATAP